VQIHERVADGLVLIGEALIGLDRTTEAAVEWQQDLDIWRLVKDPWADGLAALG
jgi:hypothetical protein